MIPALSIQNLHKSFGNTEAVRGVSFDVAEGEIFGLLGPNGAGKTTTVECIIGLRRPDSGSVHIAGINALAEPARAKEKIGAQLQWTSLHDKITPRQALRLFGSFYADAASPDELIAQFKLEKADKPFETLSGGQRQRLGLALALINKPKMIFLDEPTGGLDPLGKQELLALIAQLKQAGRSILFTTHHIDEAHRLCDRVAIMNEGKISAIDTPAALIASAKVPPWIMLKATGELNHDALRKLPGVTYAEKKEDHWRLETTQTSQTIPAIMNLIQAGKHELLDLQVHQPTLEDVFLEQTAGPSMNRGADAHREAP